MKGRTHPVLPLTAASGRNQTPRHCTRGERLQAAGFASIAKDALVPGRHSRP